MELVFLNANFREREFSDCANLASLRDSLHQSQVLKVQKDGSSLT
jgi:hypothetical protein